MDKAFDCVVVGSCVVDVLARPVPLTTPIGGGRLIESDPLLLTTGGIVSNSGITLARLGMRVAAFTYVGNDEWADVIRHRYAEEGVDTSALITHPTGATSTTAVLIDPSGERTFMHCVGAPRMLDKQAMLSQLDLFAKSRAMLIGYYPLMTRLQNDLPEVFAAIQETGCLTALDAAGDGGTMEPLARILPHVDFYLPSEAERNTKQGSLSRGRLSPPIARRAQKAGSGSSWVPRDASQSQPWRVRRSLLYSAAGANPRHHRRRRLLLWRRTGWRATWITASFCRSAWGGGRCLLHHWAWRILGHP